MSRRPIRSLVLSLVAAVSIAALGAGFAGASSLQSMLDGALQPSSAPALLAPLPKAAGQAGPANRSRPPGPNPPATPNCPPPAIRASMRAGSAALAVVLLAASAAPLGAQEYPTPVPNIRTTSAPALHALAQQREVHERFRIGLQAEQQRNWGAAAAEFERIVAIHPPEPQYSTAQYDLGIAYANAHRLDDSARAFRAAIAGDPGFLAAMANLISVDLMRGDLRDARAAADRFVALAPDSARALYSRGIVALQSGDAAAAQSDFGKLVQNDPQYALAHYNFGLAQVKLGRMGSAEHEFEIALDLAPAYARARFALGTVLLREGKRAQARAAFDRVVRDAGGDPALANLAVAMRDSIHAP